MTVHSFSTQYTTQNSSDNLPSYLQTTITALMLSIGGEGFWLESMFVYYTRGNKYIHNDDEMIFRYLLTVIVDSRPVPSRLDNRRLAERVLLAERDDALTV